MFPSPLEETGVSIWIKRNKWKIGGAVFPSPLEVTGGSYWIPLPSGICRS